MDLNQYIKIIVFLYGLCFGSFLNVCIHRIPLKFSVFRGRSNCTGCGKQIIWYDNIPVLSYLFLKGKCRFCNENIHYFYPLVEILTAFITLLIYEKTGLNWSLFINLIFVYALIVVSFIDIKHGIIPNKISIPGIVIFFTLSFFTGISPVDSLIGILTGFSILFSVLAFYYIFTKKEGMGMGDVKLLAMIGAFTGIKGVLFTLFISSLTGSIFGIFIMTLGKKSMKDSVPFGPYLSLAAITYVLWGDNIIQWYFRMIL